MDDNDDPSLDKNLIIRIEEEIQEDEVEDDILPMIDNEVNCPNDVDDIDISEINILNYLRKQLVSIFKKRNRNEN